MKKISLVALLLLIVFALTACYPAVVSSNMTITSLEGAGTKTINAYIYKNEAVKPDSTDGTLVADNFGTEGTYFLKPINDVVAFLNTKAPAGVVVSLVGEDADKYALTFTYTFDSIADYNAKTKAIIGEEQWTADDISDATLTVADAAGGKNVTYTEDFSVLEDSALWAVKALMSDTTGVYNSARATGEGLKLTDLVDVKTYAADRFPYTITIGDKTATLDETAAAITATGLIAAAPVETKAPETTDTTKNPATGDAGIMASVLLLGLCAVSLIMLKKQKA